MKMCSSLLFSFPVNFHGRQTRNLKFICDFFIFLISSSLINSAPLKYVMCLLSLFIAFTSCQIYFISFLNDPFVPSTFIFLYTSHLKDYSYLRMLICSVNPFLSIQGPSWCEHLETQPTPFLSSLLSSHIPSSNPTDPNPTWDPPMKHIHECHLALVFRSCPLPMTSCLLTSWLTLIYLYNNVKNNFLWDFLELYSNSLLSNCAPKEYCVCLFFMDLFTNYFLLENF